MGMTVSFLEDTLIAERTLRPGLFFNYIPESTTEELEHMVLDSQSLQHLNIIDESNGETGSLFTFINHCKTNFGKRQLKRWLMSPLLNPEQINGRLDSVADMINYQYETDKVRDEMKKLPDLEKLLARVFTYSIKHRCKAIYFEDVSLIKLKEFRVLLDTLK